MTPLSFHDDLSFQYVLLHNNMLGFLLPAGLSFSRDDTFLKCDFLQFEFIHLIITVQACEKEPSDVIDTSVCTERFF